MDKVSIPEEWSYCSLSNLCLLVRGVTYKKHDTSPEESDGYLPVLRANNIQDNHLVFNDLVYIPSHYVKEQQKPIEGDLIVAMSSGSRSVVGKTAFVKKTFAGGFGAFCGLLRTVDPVNNKLIGHFTRSSLYRSRVSELAAGVNINNLKPSHFDEILIPLPPLAEQKEIASRLDALLGQVERLKARVDAIPAVLKRFRQSVLAAAVSGKLTEDWSKENGESEWRTSKIDEIFVCIDGDRGPNYPKKSDYKQTGYCLFLSTKNVREYGWKFDDLVFINKQKHESLRKGTLERGDIILTTRGTLGHVASYDEHVAHEVVRINSGMLILRKRIPEYQNDFFKILIASPIFKSEIDNRRSGSAQPQLPAKVLKEFSFPIPEPAEQAEIVRRVEELFAAADKVEAQVSAAQARINQLSQSILAKAFRGELTADWRAAHPELITGEHSAEALLARIQAERATSKPAKKKRVSKAAQK